MVGLPARPCSRAFLKAFPATQAVIKAGALSLIRPVALFMPTSQAQAAVGEVARREAAAEAEAEAAARKAKELTAERDRLKSEAQAEDQAMQVRGDGGGAVRRDPAPAPGRRTARGSLPSPLAWRVPGDRWCVLPAIATFTPASPLRRRPQDEQRTLQTLNDRLAMQRLRKGDLERKIRDLGSLPDEAFEKYRGLSLKRLQQELSQVGPRNRSGASSCWGLFSRRLLP